jgi:hypothetical protein
LKQSDFTRKMEVQLLGIVAMAGLAFLSSTEAAAHGPPPTGCAVYHGLEYESDIASFVVDNGSKEYDVMSNPGIMVPVTRDQEFQVRFTLHTDDTGFRMENGTRVEANTSGAAGYAWFRDTANGYPFSKCAGPIEGDEELEISQAYPVSHMFQGEGPHLLFFETALDGSRPRAEFYLNVTGDESERESAEPTKPADEQLDEGTSSSDSILAPFLSQPNETMSASAITDAEGDALVISGSIASLYPANASGVTSIIAGGWSMAVNNTVVSRFDANVTIVSVDGIVRERYRFSNLTAVGADGVEFDSRTVSVGSKATIAAGDSVREANVAITLENLNAIRIDLDQPFGNGSPDSIYGTIDRLVVSRDGQEIRTISR